MNFLSAKPHPFLQTKGGHFGSDPQARKAVSVDYVTTTILDRGLTCGLQHKINTYYGSSIVVGLACKTQVTKLCTIGNVSHCMQSEGWTITLDLEPNP